jgi:hypothetical protein
VGVAYWLFLVGNAAGAPLAAAGRPSECHGLADDPCFALLQKEGSNPFDAFDPDEPAQPTANYTATYSAPYAKAALLPPLITLVGGWRFVWAFRGFRKNT